MVDWQNVMGNINSKLQYDAGLNTQITEFLLWNKYTYIYNKQKKYDADIFEFLTDG